MGSRALQVQEPSAKIDKGNGQPSAGPVVALSSPPQRSQNIMLLALQDAFSVTSWPAPLQGNVASRKEEPMKIQSSLFWLLAQQGRGLRILTPKP